MISTTFTTRSRRTVLLGMLALMIGMLGVFAMPAMAQDAPEAPVPTEAPEMTATPELPGAGDVIPGGGQMNELMKIVLVLSALTLLPAVLLSMTAFTRVVIVMSFVRRALSVQQMPPNQILIGLSLFITFFIMAPVLKDIHETAVQPAVNGEISEFEAIKRAEGPLRKFMLDHTRKKDLLLFVNISGMERPKTRGDVPTYIVLPAFALSEIKTAFQMGFVIFLPMLVIDIVVATLLTSMGMFMLPPAMVSVPVKILVFVMVDGWHLVIGSLARSF
jgi:flagellar biosynthesis protein FliP